MAIPKKDADAIKRLAREGKAISNIMEQDFPEYDYWEIYGVVYGGGERSALGAKRMIANRLKKLPNIASASERKRMIDEVDELVWHLYQSLKASQQKLDAIRKTLNK